MAKMKKEIIAQEEIVTQEEPKEDDVKRDVTTGPATNLALVCLQEGEAAGVKLEGGKAIFISTGADEDVIIDIDKNSPVIVTISQ